LDEIKNVSANIQLIAGELDDLIPPKDVQLIYDKANNPKSISVVPKIGHDYRQNIEQIQTINKIIIEHLAKQGF